MIKPLRPMLKQAFSLFLTLGLAGLFNPVVYAETSEKPTEIPDVVYLELSPASIPQLMPQKLITSSDSVLGQSKVIHCNQEFNHPLCKLVKISKQEIPLHSGLKAKHQAFVYKVSNTNLNAIEISEIKNFDHPDQNFQKTQEQGIGSLSTIFLLPITIVRQGVSNSESRYGKILDSIAVMAMVAPITTLLGGAILLVAIPATVIAAVWYIAGAPFHIAQQKKSAKALKEEAAEFIREFPPQRIGPGQKIEFAVLATKSLRFQFKDITTNNEFVVQY